MLREYRRIVTLLLPGWSTIKCAAEATYLGVRVGPAATRDAKWHHVVAEYKKRTSTYASSIEAPSLMVRTLRGAR